MTLRLESGPNGSRQSIVCDSCDARLPSIQQLHMIVRDRVDAIRRRYRLAAEAR